jgi:hypothetical protein
VALSELGLIDGYNKLNKSHTAPLNQTKLFSSASTNYACPETHKDSPHATFRLSHALIYFTPNG